MPCLVIRTSLRGLLCEDDIRDNTENEVIIPMGANSTEWTTVFADQEYTLIVSLMSIDVLL